MINVTTSLIKIYQEKREFFFEDDRIIKITDDRISNIFDYYAYFVILRVLAFD